MGIFSRVRRSAARATVVERVDPTGLAFGLQREAILCHAPLVGLCCSGRSGKTRGALLKWLEVAERKPGELSAFIALTLKSAKRTAWRQLLKLDREMKLGLVFNKSDLTVTHPSGSQLILLGANRDDLIDVLRGSPFAFVFLDEVAFFREGLVQNAIDDALIIRMLDLDGELWIGSTPGYVEAGYHYDVVNGNRPGWRVFHWTYFDNPHLPEYPVEPDAEKRRSLRLKAALKVREQMGWSETTPSYVREWLGKYVDDPESLVYAFRRSLHTVQDMPASWYAHRDRWHTVLGMDFGSTNATTWVLWAFEKHSPVCYAVKALRHYNMSPGETADITRKWVNEFKPDTIVGDSAAKGYIDEHRVRQQIAIQGANKLGKRAHQLSMNDAFRFSVDGGLDENGKEIRIPQPRIFLVAGATDDYASELERLGKDPRFKRTVKADGTVAAHVRYGEEDPNGVKDLCDGGLYGWERCWAWIEELKRQEAEEQERLARLDPVVGTTHEYRPPRRAVPEQYVSLAEGFRTRIKRAE